MRISKKIPVYIFILIILVSFGLVYAATAKNIWNQKDAGAKRASQKSGSAPDAGSSSASTTVVSPVSSSPEQIPPAPADTQAATPVADQATAALGTSEYPLHSNISTTYFWAGEDAGKDNGNISNLPSAWDEDWVKHFGGIDNPKKRNGFLPAGFTPKENPFYFALPYNDFNANGNQKNDPVALALWGTGGKKFGAEQSMCKNQWIKITKGGKTCYAQWEDVGPFGEDDKTYVFGGSAPKSKENSHAGLDVSPAVHDFLALGDVDKTSWQFIDAALVPAGPWKNIVTISQVYWK